MGRAILLGTIARCCWRAPVPVGRNRVAVMTLRRRVLLICREPALLLELQSQFGSRTHDVFATPDYTASIRLAYELQPDVVLLVAPDGDPGDWLAFVQAL